MASSGGALNLSLLSRGVGEISKNGHEKIDVVFEPQVRILHMTCDSPRFLCRLTALIISL